MQRLASWRRDAALTFSIAVGTLLVLVAACGDDPPANQVDPTVDADANATSDAANDGDAKPKLSVTTDVRCATESIDALGLHDVVASGLIDEEGTEAGSFLSHVDATAGGISPTESFLYARFTSEGLVKVAIDDLQAFESTEWDIAFRRAWIRLNSGVSGSGNVRGIRVWERRSTIPGTRRTLVRRRSKRTSTKHANESTIRGWRARPTSCSRNTWSPPPPARS